MLRDVASSSEATTKASSEPTSRAARRRRMEIRRYRFVAEAETMPSPEEAKRKRQRLEEKDVAVDTVGDGNGSPATSNPDRPRVTSVQSETSDHCPRYGVTSVCGRRRDMEDTVSIRPDFVQRATGRYHFFGVFDGHGCSHVAESCRQRMYGMVAEEVKSLGSSDTLPQGGWKLLMEKSFSRMDAEAVGCCTIDGRPRKSNCRCELLTPKCEHVGSTAVVAVVGPTQIVVANCGDSRAVLSRKGVPIPLSTDHKPDRPDELQRIHAAGGRVIYWDGARVLGVLAMSRAIGDGYLKPFVISEPEVTVAERGEEDECLILASDGLWDVVTNEMACEIVRVCLRNSTPPEEGKWEDNGRGSDKACAEAAVLLTKLALARQSADNVSVVVVDLRQRKL
ncbi:probable protein phosphatase 2C 9 [Typha latifolia]|uniref:probable protein phosphatase 2C 9 n=1 Tax=Typha latifolia TaxID=4733 RepID=UPI003C2AD184